MRGKKRLCKCTKEKNSAPFSCKKLCPLQDNSKKMRNLLPKICINAMDSIIRITKEFTFETGHALHGYDGLCKNVHGHSYKLSVSVKGRPINDPNHVKNGMVIDFSDLKKIVKEEIVVPFDHATVLNINTPHKELADEMEQRGHKILRVNYQPTSEMLVTDFAEKISARLPKNIVLVGLKLRETETSFAEWLAEEQH